MLNFRIIICSLLKILYQYHPREVAPLASLMAAAITPLSQYLSRAAPTLCVCVCVCSSVNCPHAIVNWNTTPSKSIPHAPYITTKDIPTQQQTLSRSMTQWEKESSPVYCLESWTGTTGRVHQNTNRMEVMGREYIMGLKKPAVSMKKPTQEQQEDLRVFKMFCKQ